LTKVLKFSLIETVSTVADHTNHVSIRRNNMTASWEQFEREVKIEVTLKVTEVSAKGALKIAEASGSADIDGGTVVLKRSRNGQVYFNLTHEAPETPELDPPPARPPRLSYRPLSQPS
jgi:hypothetical protein